MYIRRWRTRDGYCFPETARASNSGIYGKMYQMINTYDSNTGGYLLSNTPEARYAYLGDAEMLQSRTGLMTFSIKI